MPTTLDFHELLRALSEHPEWREELRRVLLTEELLSLPEVVRELTEQVRHLAGEVDRLAEAQQRTEQELKELAQAQRRTEEQVKELSAEVKRLAEAQKRTEQQVKELAAKVERLTEAQQRTEQRVEELAEAQKRTEQQVKELAESQRQLTEAQAHMERRLQRVEERLDHLWGHDVERRYKDRAAAYFGRLLSDVEVLDTQALAKLLDQARKAGRISHEERGEILWADVVVRGENEQGLAVAFLLEASSVVAQKDVLRAKTRAELLSKALEIPVYPAVAGERIPPKVAALCQAQGVWQLENGRVLPPPGVEG